MSGNGNRPFKAHEQAHEPSVPAPNRARHACRPGCRLTPAPTNRRPNPGFFPARCAAAQPVATGPGRSGYRTAPPRQPPHGNPSSPWGGPRAGGREPSGWAREALWPRISPITAGSSILAITRTWPPHARQVIAAWRVEYNTERTHSSLGDITPAEFVAVYRQRAGETVSLTADSNSGPD